MLFLWWLPFAMSVKIQVLHKQSNDPHILGYVYIFLLVFVVYQIKFIRIWSQLLGFS